MKKDCPKWKKDLRGEKPSVGVAKGSSLFDGCEVVLATSESPRMSYCILDSSCSFHMCSVL